MFADPMSISVNSVAKSLIRIRFDNYSSEYLLREATQEFTLKIRNTTGKATAQKSVSGQVVANQPNDRHNVELIQRVYATATTPEYVRKAYMTFEHNHADTVLEPVYVAKALADFMSVANLTKLSNFES